MSIKKVTLASLILLSLTACSSGGSGGSSSNATNAKPQTTQQQADKAAAEKAAEEKAEAERLAAEKAAEEKAEAERLAAEKAAEEKAEAERLAAEKAKIDSYKSLMLTINNDVESWRNPTFTNFTLPENAALGLTRNIKQTIHQEVRNDVETDSTYTRQYDLYNQKYSIVLGKHEKYHNPKNDYGFEVNQEVYSIIGTSGLKTDPVALPKEGTATYSGKAFNLHDDGVLNYTVNFASKEGYGKIEGISELGTIELEKGNIVKKVSSNQLEISSDVTLNDWKEHQVSGTYALVFYGEDANEVAGSISLRQEHSIYNPVTGEVDSVSKYLPNNSESIGFAGTRGEIK